MKTVTYHSTENYTITVHSFGNYSITCHATDKNLYLQGDDAELITNELKFIFNKPTEQGQNDCFDSLCSEYIQ